jgi:hypothetical protein
VYDYRWGGQSNDVFGALEGDFMKPRIDEVRCTNRNIFPAVTASRNYCFQLSDLNQPLILFKSDLWNA